MRTRTIKITFNKLIVVVYCRKQYSVSDYLMQLSGTAINYLARIRKYTEGSNVGSPRSPITVVVYVLDY